MPLVIMVSVVVGIVIFIIIVAAGIVSFIHQVERANLPVGKVIWIFGLESEIKNDNEQATVKGILNDLANIGSGWNTRLYSRHLTTKRCK